MSLLHLPRPRRTAPLPVLAPDAILDSVQFEGGPASSLGLTGLWAFLGTEAGDDGHPYGQLRVGTAPGGHLILCTPSPEYCSAAIAALARMRDALYQAREGECPAVTR